MGNDQYLVSIAMPVVNVERTILSAIRSLLKQTYREWECLVIDDGSSDNTIGVLRSISDTRVRILSDGTHKGLAARLNEAIALSRGNYFARMDGDDIAYPCRLERQIDYLTTHPEVNLLGTYALVFGVGGRILGKRGENISRPWRYRLMMKTVPIVHPTFVGKMEWFRTHAYQEWSDYFQDQQLLVSNLDQIQFAVLPEILLGYREEQLSIVKQTRYRWSHIRSFPFLRQQSGLVIAIFATLIQFIKLAVDILAISTGLDYRLLKSRAMPVSPEDLSLWRQVWDSVNVENE